MSRVRPLKLSGDDTSRVSPPAAAERCIGVAMPRCLTWGSANTWSMVYIGPHGIPASSKTLIQYSAVWFWVISPIAALIAARSLLRPLGVRHSGLAGHSGRPITVQKRSHIRPPLAAILTYPSLVGNTPVGIPVGW